MVLAVVSGFLAYKLLRSEILRLRCAALRMTSFWDEQRYTGTHTYFRARPVGADHNPPACARTMGGRFLNRPYGESDVAA